MLDNIKVMSIQVRLQRTTVEYAYVSIEVTPELITESNNLNGEKVFDLALECCSLPEIQWYPEKQTLELHPIQKEREPNEKSLFKGQSEVYLL